MCRFRAVLRLDLPWAASESFMSWPLLPCRGGPKALTGPPMNRDA